MLFEVIAALAGIKKLPLYTLLNVDDQSVAVDLIKALRGIEASSGPKYKDVENVSEFFKTCLQRISNLYMVTVTRDVSCSVQTTLYGREALQDTFKKTKLAMAKGKVTMPQLNVFKAYRWLLSLAEWAEVQGWIVQLCRGDGGKLMLADNDDSKDAGSASSGAVVPFKTVACLPQKSSSCGNKTKAGPKAKAEAKSKEAAAEKTSHLMNLFLGKRKKCAE